MDCGCASLIESVTERAVARARGHVVALYTYGSAVTAEMDAWSDLDVCMIHKPSGEALQACRSWANDLLEAYSFRVDPVGIGLDQMGDDCDWSFAPFIHALVANSRLLFGEDVRSAMTMPSLHKMRLAACQIAGVALRRLYGIPREVPLPESLPAMGEPTCEPKPFGNAAWMLYTAVLALLQAIVLLESGIVCGTKRSVQQETALSGDRWLSECCADAAAVRRATPRFGPLGRTTAELERLSMALPALGRRFSDGLSAHGLADPSHEPSGISLYYRAGNRRGE